MSSSISTGDGTLAHNGRGVEGVSATDIAISGYERTPQTPLTPEELRDGIEAIFDELLSILPAGPTSHIMKFGTKGQLEVHTDPDSVPSLSGSYLANDGNYSTFSAINVSEGNTGTFQLVRTKSPLDDPEKYRCSKQGLAFLKSAITDLFATDDTPQENGIPTLAEARMTAEDLIDSYR